MVARKNLTPLQARARHIRHAGYVFYASAVLWLAISLTGSMISGLRDETARDPTNGQLVVNLTQQCQDWASELLGARDAIVDGHDAHADEAKAAWRVRAEGWKLRCGAVEGDAPLYLLDAMR